MSERVRPCACGGVLRARRGAEMAVVMAHNAGEQHRVWRAIRECEPLRDDHAGAAWLVQREQLVGRAA